MTTLEFVFDLGRANLALSGGILVVLALRLPLRRWLGARVAYGLWLIPVIATLAVIAPPRTVTVQAPPPAAASIEVTEPAAPAPPQPTMLAPANPGTPWPRPETLLLAVWLIGAGGALAWFVRNQRRFLRLVIAGQAGPAAVGVIRPRIVLPADFEARFSRPERAAILAHEQAHLAAQHPRTNALIALIQAASWFNPLVHLGAHLMRIDQELACDATVMAQRPKLRGLYAQTLLKTQLAATPLPIGCYWPPRSEHPLTMRVSMLNRPTPGRGPRILGGAAIAGLAIAGGLGAWAAQPARQVALASMSLTQWWQDSDDPKAHTTEGQAAYVAALRRAHDLASKQAQNYAKQVRWDVEHDEAPVTLMYYALLDRSLSAWPTPASDSDRSPIALAGELRLKDGRRIKIDIHDAGFAQFNERIDAADGHVSLALATHTPQGILLRAAVGLTDGQMIFAPPTVLVSGEEKTIPLDGGDALLLRATVRAAPPAPIRVKSITMTDPPDGTEVVGDRMEVTHDGRTQIFTGHVQVKQGEQVRLADRLVIHNSPKALTVAQAQGETAVAIAELALDAALQKFRAGLISQAELHDKERDLRHAQSDLRMVKPSAAPVLTDAKARALAAGDWREAARQGATAAEVVRALQAKGRLKDIVPEEAVVSIGPDGAVEVIPMKPLPPITERTVGGSTNLNGTGFTFGSKPGTIVLYPQSATTFGNGPAAQVFIPTSVPATSPPAGWRSFAAVFDGSAPISLKGKVTRVEWTNPHALVHMIDAATGQAWAVETGTPNTLTHSGLTPDQVAAGVEISVRGYGAKDRSCSPECLGMARDITFGDGRKVFIGAGPGYAAIPAGAPASVATALNAEAKAAVIRAAQADVDLARATYDDAERRYTVGLITTLELQGLKRDVAVAEARLAVAKAN